MKTSVIMSSFLIFLKNYSKKSKKPKKSQKKTSHFFQMWGLSTICKNYTNKCNFFLSKSKK